jgi:hypothetical protein
VDIGSVLLIEQSGNGRSDYVSFTPALALCADGTLAVVKNDKFAPVDTSGVLNGKTVTAIAGGREGYLILCSDGTLIHWEGTNENPPDLVNVSTLPAGATIVAISEGMALYR